MKVLLIAVNAKYIHSNLAVYNLKASAGDYKEQVVIKEYTVNHRAEQIIEGIYREKADVVCFSCYIWNIKLIEHVAHTIKQVMPAVRLWFGGPEVSFDVYSQLKRLPWLEGIMYREGEDTFRELMEAFNYQRGLELIEGIFYRDAKGDIVLNRPREYVDMSKIPFVYEDMEAFQHKIVYYETSRGCAFSCTYCLSSVSKYVRFRSLDLVKKELQQFIDWEVPQVKFLDRTFNYKRSHSMAILQYIKEHDKGKTNFHFEIMADMLNEDEIKFMSTLRPGLIQLEIGVQSTNPATLNEIHRYIFLDKLQKVVRAINAGHNIHQHLDLIAGLPYEDIIRFKHSFNDVYALEPEQLQLGFLKVLKGSCMQEKAEEYALVYDSEPPYEVLSTRWLSFDEILILKGIEEMVEVYYNSRQFENSIRLLAHCFNSPYDMFEAMAAWYRKKELTGISHSRMARYDILLEFAAASISDVAVTAILKEALVYDLYLRENLKKRPEWASDNSAYKDLYIRFFADEDNRMKFFPEYAPFTSKQVQRMMHIEHFSFDVARTVETGKKTGQEQFILFDYKKRNALTYQSFAQQIEVSKDEIK